MERVRRARKMVAKMDELGFGNCTNTGACAAECPKNISLSNIARGHFRYARKIADFCRKRHLELVLVTTPAWHSYYENLDPIQAEMTDSLIGVLRDQYGLHYLDYMRGEQ